MPFADQGTVPDKRGIHGAVLLEVLVDQLADLGISPDDTLLDLFLAQSGARDQVTAATARAVGRHRDAVPGVRVEDAAVGQGLDLHTAARRTGHVHGIDQAGSRIKIVGTALERQAFRARAGVRLVVDTQDMTARRPDPAVVGELQIIFDLGSLELHHIELVLIGIDRKHVVVDHLTRLDGAVEGQGRRKRELHVRGPKLDRVDEIEVIAHAAVGVARAELHREPPDGLQREFAHPLEDGAEMRLHRLVHLVLVHPDDLRLHRALPALGLADDSMADVARAGAAVDHPAAVFLGNGRTMVVRADEQVHALQRLQQVEALALEDLSVAVADAGMRQDDHHVRALLGPDPVHPLLCAGNQRLEVDAAPDRLGEPGLHVGVGQAEDGHLVAAAAEDLVGGEIGGAVVLADGIGAQEGDAVRGKLRRDLVIDRMAGLDVVVAHGHGVVFHIGDELDWDVDGDLHIHLRVERVDAENVWCTFLEDNATEPNRLERTGFEAQIDNGRFTPVLAQGQEEEIIPDTEPTPHAAQEAAPLTAEETVSLPLSVEAAAEYNDLKARYPNALIGFEQHGFYEFYGEDARTAAQILNARTLEKEIPGGHVSVTGFPADRWQSFFRQLWRKGNDVYLAGEKADGTHEETKFLYARDFLPVNAVVHIRERAYRIDRVDFDRDTVRLLDITGDGDPRFPPTLEESTDYVRSFLEEEPLIPVSEETKTEINIPAPTREETMPEKSQEPPAPRMMETVVELTDQGYQVTETRPVREYQYDCMFHDIAYLDGQAYQVEKIGLFDVTFQPLETENIYPVARVESMERLETLLAQDDRNSHLLRTSTLEQRQQAREAWQQSSAPQEPSLPPGENFRISDDHLGEGGAKTKFRNNMAAIYTMKALEAEGRPATQEEQEVMSKYVGWGGLANAFDETKQDWTKEYAELKEALTPEEYTAARASTLNAHYTSPTVIRAIYEALGNMGFKTGNILEPAMGVGNFFGMLPEEMRSSKLYGVELDSITGRIAKQLYPQADITVAGFETTDRRDFFDVAVGNVPFGNYKVNDRAYNKLGFNIHNYFFAKALDQVRPGGIVAFVTSRYTMDAKSPEVRKYLAQRAELLGAIRLPSNAFTANAGTEVTTDIIFLQKRDRPIEVEPDWVHLGETEDGIPINSYYVEHPDMVLGTMVWEDKMYGYEKETACQPIPGTDLGQQLSEAVQRITGTYQEAELPELAEGEEIDDSIPADPAIPNFSYTVVNGNVYYRENSRMVRPKLSQTAQERTAGMVELRDCVRQLMNAQLENASDADIHALQERLNTLYDAYTAKYGLINSRGNALAFADDSSYYLLCSLEMLDENGNLERKADMFTKRTIRQQQVVDHVDTAVEALAVSIAERAKVDLPYMAYLTGKGEDEIASELTGVIFRLPEAAGKDGRSRYVTADEYLSGNVRQKLRIAQSWAESDDSFQVNVKALEGVQPQDLSASEIDVRLGATWIDKKYIQQFMYETFNTPRRNRWNDYIYASNRYAVTVNFSPLTAEASTWQRTERLAQSAQALMTCWKLP